MSDDLPPILVQSLNNFLRCPMLDVVDHIFASHFVAHVPIMPLLTRSGYKSFVQGLYSAFPDWVMEVGDTITSPDWLVLRMTFCGSHQGSFLGIPPTGCSVTIPCICIFRVEHGVLVENWTEMDILGVIRSISDDSATGYQSSLN